MKPTPKIVNSLNRRQFGVAAGATLAAAALPRAARAAPVTIRVGWVRVPVSTGPLMLAKKGLLRNFGKSYVAEVVRFPQSGALGAALTSGEIEVGPMNLNPLAQTLAKNADLRIIADELQDGFPGYGTNPLMVRKDGPIKLVADLKGKVLVTNIFGAPLDVAMRVMARRSGLEANRDYTIILEEHKHQWELLADKKADLIGPAIPYNFNPKLTAIADTLFTQKDALGITQLESYVAKASFIQNNRTALVDFLEDMVLATRWYSDPKNHEEVVAIVARINEGPPADWDWSFTKRDQYRDPNRRPNLEALKRNWQVQREFGLLNVDLDPFQFSDLSMVDEAAKRVA